MNLLPYFRRYFRRFLNPFRKSRHDRELHDELDAHLQLHIEDNLRAGLSHEQARRQALLSLGGLEQTKESVRDQRSLPLLESLLQDARFAARLLRKSPAFTAIAVLTLALGIGANTAIFSVMRQVLLLRLPVWHPEQLVLLYSPGPRDGHVSSDEGDGSESFSYAMYLNLRDQNTVFSGLAAKADFPVSISVRGETERAEAELVSGNYFSTLGVRPVLGRLFDPSDSAAPGASPVVLLAYPYWQNRFGGDPSILNQSILVNNQSMTVVGVSQPGFDGIQPGLLSDVYIPITMKPVVAPNSEDNHHRGLMNHNDYWAKLIGRLKPGLSRKQATIGLLPTYRALLANEVPLNSGLNAQEKKQFAERQIILRDGSRGRPILEQHLRPKILTLMGMVALVLLITCANVAGLLIARGAARQKEISIRLSLGASRGRLIRQLILESCSLSFLGAFLGLFFAHWIAGAVVHGAMEEGLSADLNLPVLLFTLIVALLCGIFFGVAPALSATRVQLASTLKEQAGSPTPAVSHAHFRKVLVVGQFALTLLLVTGAWGFVRSLYNLKNVDLGFQPDHVLQFSIAPALNGYDQARSLSLYSQLEEKLAALPGVHSLSGAEVTLIDNQSRSSNITLEGFNDTPDVQYNCIGTAYFSNLRIPLVRGREFSLADNENSPKVAVVNEALAKKYFRDGQGLGKRMRFGGHSGPLDIEIVGVVRNSHHDDIDEDPRPFVYVPYRQRNTLNSLTYYVRSSTDPVALIGSVRSTLAELDATLPIYDVRSFEEQIDQRLSSRRLLAVLALSFGALAALLAALGIYALLAYTVAQRTREIGVRMALGAEPKRVTWMVLREVTRLTVFGILLGIPLAYAAGKFIDSLLYGVRSFGVSSSAIALLTLTAVAGFASYIPARRASRVDPIIALRYE
jgi:putative ABC transport system permease protein